MELNQRLFDIFQNRSANTSIELLSLGLGYTAVTTSDGGIGLSYTYFDRKTSCSLIRDYHDYEGHPCIELLEKIKGADPLQRSMALALINALFHDKALVLPEDADNDILFKEFNLLDGPNVAMVGFFRPIANTLKKQGVPLEILDDFHGVGTRERFYEKLGSWAEVLLLTSTSILNNTTEEILEKANARVRTVMLGPSTPMVPEAFEHLPVHMLAGTVPVDKAMVLKAIRHGLGTPFIQRHSKKAFHLIGESSRQRRF